MFLFTDFCYKIIRSEIITSTRLSSTFSLLDISYEMVNYISVSSIIYFTRRYPLQCSGTTVNTL